MTLKEDLAFLAFLILLFGSWMAVIIISDQCRVGVHWPWIC
jgi:hypothetical protein